MQRVRFTIVTDTGVPALAVKGDTGLPIYGEIAQVRIVPAVADTGGDLELGLLPAGGDTGAGWSFLTLTDGLGAARTVAPRQPTHDATGAVDATDTGTPAAPACIVAAGDRLRIKVRAGRVVAAGGTNSVDVYVWVRD